jgi:hypothetical protein
MICHYRQIVKLTNKLTNKNKFCKHLLLFYRRNALNPSITASLL